MLLVLLSIVILTLDFRDVGFVQSAREAVGNALAPVRRAAESAFEPIENAWNGITDYGDLKAENEELRAELDELRGEAVQDENAAEQLEVLLEQREIEWVGSIPRTTARVIAGPASNFVHTIDIDKGRADGIREGMPVVTGAGLLGRVERVGSDRSTVQTVEDPELKVGVRVVGLNSLATARGQGAGEPLLADSEIPVDDEDDVPEGGNVTTSGTDFAAYPSDIPVGEITAVRPATNGLNLELDIEPFVDVNELSYVQVLLREPEE